jgi:hypothetical protein
MTKRIRTVYWTAAGLFAAFLAAQLVPVSRTNPPIETEAPAPPEIRAVLRRACYDCHSNETVWPWYSHVAPVSWLVADDVNHGRSHLNFSTWNRLTPDEQASTLREAWEQIDGGNMPLWYYLPLHSAARLSEADKELLRGWMQPQRDR